MPVVRRSVDRGLAEYRHALCPSMVRVPSVLVMSFTIWRLRARKRVTWCRGCGRRIRVGVKAYRNRELGSVCVRCMRQNRGLD